MLIHTKKYLELQIRINSTTAFEKQHFDTSEIFTVKIALYTKNRT